MADSIQGGYLRGAAAAAQGYGPLVVAPAAGASMATAAAPVTGAVYSGSTALTPKYKLLNLAASATATTVVAAVTAKKIRVLACVFVAGSTATNLTFNSASSAISCLFANAANGGASLPFNPAGWFETVAGEALTATTGAGSTTGIQLVYVEV